MKSLIFHTLTTATPPSGFTTRMKLSYLLHLDITWSGITKYIFDWAQVLENTDLDYKVNYLLKDINLNEQEKNMVFDYQKSLKAHRKIKSKSSKQMYAYQILKRSLEKFFNAVVQDEYKQINKLFDLEGLKPLVSSKEYMYCNSEMDDAQIKTRIADILQLNLPEDIPGRHIFFLHTEDSQGNCTVNLEIQSPDSRKAENQNYIYGQKGIPFPLITGLSSGQIMVARQQLTEAARELNQQLDKWAEICYSNPNSNAGLEYFRENLSPLLKASDNMASKSQLLQNVSDYKSQNDQTQLVIGEAPIEKIWEIYKQSHSISEETFDELIKIKTEQYPKYEGRWPVMFLKSIPAKTDYAIPTNQTETVESVRKTITID